MVSSDQHSSASDSNDTSISADSILQEKRRRNLQASIKFRVNKKHKTLELENKLRKENETIEKLKLQLHKLEIENKWLRKFLIGGADPLESTFDLAHTSSFAN